LHEIEFNVGVELPIVPKRFGDEFLLTRDLVDGNSKPSDLAESAAARPFLAAVDVG